MSDREYNALVGSLDHELTSDAQEPEYNDMAYMVIIPHTLYAYNNCRAGILH